MMRNARLVLVALSIVAAGACQPSITGPVDQQEGYAGSGGQVSPADAAPERSEGYAGSGG